MATHPWTLDRLRAEVEAALSVDYTPATSGRVRAVPDRRTIRYYTTLGLVSRPELRGRTAYYGERHLLELVAIKRLQADGLTLTDIQQRLAGLDVAALAAIAQLPEDAPLPAPAPAQREAFWAAVPPAATDDAEPVEAADGAASDQDAAATLARLTGLPLTTGVTLLLRGAPELSDADLRAVRKAALPLLTVLTSRNLLGSLPDAPRSTP